MSTLFISDLHLDDQRPEATKAFLAFLHDEASGAEALYILGDLFEYWIGDDFSSATGNAVIEALASLTSNGVPCFFMHGNRDFLLGNAFARQAGITLLAEEHVIDLYGCPTLLLHGDSLCTDDHEYQQVRQMLRNPEWQKAFLSKTPQERIQAALEARELSAEHKEGVSMAIMDVNAAAVAEALQRHHVSHMIHGHTHRPNIHEPATQDDERSQRIVLGDWYEQGSVLTVSPGGLSLDALPY